MLALEEKTPFHREFKYDQWPLPISDEVADMYALTHDILVGKEGFTHYEVSNYA